MENTGQLDPTRNPTQPAIRLTHLKMTRLTRDPFDPQTRLTQPTPTRPDRFATSIFHQFLLNLSLSLSLSIFIDYIFIINKYIKSYKQIKQQQVLQII